MEKSTNVINDEKIAKLIKELSKGKLDATGKARESKYQLRRRLRILDLGKCLNSLVVEKSKLADLKTFELEAYKAGLTLH